MKLWTYGSPTTTLLPPRQSLLSDPNLGKCNPWLKGFADQMKCAVTDTLTNPKWSQVSDPRSAVDRFCAGVRQGGFDYGEEGRLFDITGVPDERIAVPVDGREVTVRYRAEAGRHTVEVSGHHGEVVLEAPPEVEMRR